MRKVSYFVGQGIDRNGRQIDVAALPGIQNKVYQYLIAEFGGFTAYPGVGGYRDGNVVALEPSITFVVYTDAGDRSLENGAKFLREAFLQSEVLYSFETAAEVYSV